MRSVLIVFALVVASLASSGCFRVDQPEAYVPVSNSGDVGQDADGEVSLCGDGLLQPAEACDPGLEISSPGACPSQCEDGDACTSNALLGAADTCDAVCPFAPIQSCTADDGCCPAGCTPADDMDCASVCGDGILSGAETCEPGIATGQAGACPRTEDCPPSTCATASIAGTAANCDVECQYIEVVACIDGDACCPSGCDVTTDKDCAPSCGNGVVDVGETCDPVAGCPTSCDDGVACTVDSVLGSPANCDRACLSTQTTNCVFTSDGCCPPRCTSARDSDCVRCATDADCGPLEYCNDVLSCVEALACSNARTPDAWCAATAGGGTCDTTTDTCFWACGVAADCPRPEDACTGGRCNDAPTCSVAADPDQWCVVLGAGDVCLLDECATRCTSACDCPLRHLQSCGEVLGIQVCLDSVSCGDVCPGFEDLSCETTQGAGSTCAAGGCVPP